MKKTLTAALLVVVMLIPTAAQAQFRLGVKGGLNVTSLSFDSEVFNSENRVGYFAGLTAKVQLPISGLAIDAATLYDVQNVSISDEDFERKAITVPVNLRITVPIVASTSVYIAAGPQVSFNLDDEELQWNDADSWNQKLKWSSSDFSVNLGAGVTFGRLEVGVAYNIGVGKTGEITTQSVYDAVSDDIKTNKWDIKNRKTWKISAAFYL